MRTCYVISMIYLVKLKLYLSLLCQNEKWIQCKVGDDLDRGQNQAGSSQVDPKFLDAFALS